MITHIFTLYAIELDGEITRLVLADENYEPEIQPGEDEFWRRTSLSDYFDVPVEVAADARKRMLRERLAALNTPAVKRPVSLSPTGEQLAAGLFGERPY